MYSIKEIYKTIQGEGAQSGRTAVFVRFTGCNLWSGKEKHRESSICNFCDTDFVGTDGINGGKYSCKSLVSKIKDVWQSKERGYIVFTGGEPMLQLNEELILLCKENNFETAIETNGTIKIDFGASKALRNGKSLLAAGVTRVDGFFNKGENVLIIDQNNIQLARGLSSFSSVEINKIK